MDKSNSINRSHKALSRETKHHPKYISKVLDELEEARLISVEKKWIIINPDFVWYGKEDEKKYTISQIFWARVRKKNGLVDNGK